MLRAEIELVKELAREIAKEEIAAAMKELAPVPEKELAVEERTAEGGKQ